MSDSGSDIKTAQESGPLSVAVEAEECFNYAAWQNAVRVVHVVRLANPTDVELSGLTVELTATPAFAEPKRWTVDRVGPGESVDLRSIDLDVDAAYLSTLDEAIRAVLRLRVDRDGKTIAECSQPVRVLARDEWGGMASMAELLPAFVTPNDLALAPLLKSASEVLGKNGHPTGLDGYQTGDPNRSYLLAAALWSAVAERSLTYATPPSSFERVGQKTRRVATVLGDGLATCLDSTLLFASGLEAMGLNPVLVMLDGHCFAGVWLVKQTLSHLNESDPSELRKAIAAKELVVFETTLVTHQPVPGFESATAHAEAALAEEREHEFVGAIDVERGRMSQVLPLASHAERTESPEGEAVESVTPALPAAPGIGRPLADEEEPRPTTPAGRIDRWQRKLLDLSLRNRLLNFRPSKQTVPVICPDVSALEDRLADGKRMRLVSLTDENEIPDRDAELHQQRTQKDLDLEFAREAMDRGEIACAVEGSDLDRRLTTLFRKVKNDLAEGGSNTLFLAVGFLRWKQKPTDERSYRAPLLLVPVKLTRRSASSPFYLTHHEDEVCFNATLLQLLKKDFDCDLTDLESNLPADDSGIDVPAVLGRVRRAVREVPGFEVVEDAAIASFSFAKYLMWKDLVERVDQLERNRVVRHLVKEPDKAFVGGGEGPMPQPHEIDTRYSPAEIVHPLPADSSQLTAVMAASEGHDLVIVGPPGTGKSQTIANLIAQCLAVGKTVLFVAEKTAALDVVHRRLRQNGLGDCCVELHSSKAERRRFLEQLGSSWVNRTRPSDREWVEVSERLRVRRDELNGYVAAIHAVHPNGWTIHRAMGLCVRRRDWTVPTLAWPRETKHDRQSYESLRSAVGDYELARRSVPVDVDLGRLNVGEWSMGWESDLLACCESLRAASVAVRSSIDRLSNAIDVPLGPDVSSASLSKVFRLCRELSNLGAVPRELMTLPDLDALKSALSTRQDLRKLRSDASDQLKAALEDLDRLLAGDTRDGFSEDKKRSYYRLANCLIAASPQPGSLVFHPEFAQLGTLLQERSTLLERESAAAEAVEARGFERSLLDRLDVTEVEKRWNSASRSFWPLSAFRKASVRKQLKPFLGGGDPEPELDLAVLREQAEAKQDLDQNLESLGLPAELSRLVEKDTAGLESQLDAASSLREAIAAAGYVPADVGELNGGTLDPLVNAARRLYPPGREMERLRVELGENLNSLSLPDAMREAVESDPGRFDQPIGLAISLRDATQGLGVSWPAVAQTLADTDESSRAEVREAAASYCHDGKAFGSLWKEYSQLAGMAPAASDTQSVLTDAEVQASRLLSARTMLQRWTSLVATQKRAESLGLAGFVEEDDGGSDRLGDRFELAYARWWVGIAVDGSETLRTFRKAEHEEAVRDFSRLDDLALAAASSRAMRTIYHDLPGVDKVPRKSELGLLRHQMGLKRPSKAIRELITVMPESFGKLAPCLLMSPLSIAQYLPPGQEQFDVVVFDEASQIATWDAIGAIARGKQTIIVGDPKQLPPTNFFGRAESDESDEELGDFEKDLESILDEAQASGLPTLQLNWHYRSRHESLIAFSNYNYYDNKLVTFPAAESADRGVSLTHTANGVYDRGKSRTNRVEAEAIVADAVGRMQRCLAKPEAERLTYGVVTFNSQQQTLIQDLFDQSLRECPELEWFFADERVEPTAVKNLENVQGDERDVMYFSITFGKDASGKFPVDFGAVNRDGGERRLNVAVTRARQALFVYASFLPDEVRAERSKARGVHDLKAFLDFAHRGAIAISARTEGSVGDFESPFEEAVAQALDDRGWEVEPQIGVSGFRIDLGIVHPDRPGAYLAGVECDGATYHRSAAARDRDKTRQVVLEGLGWELVRVWSPEWWYDSDSAIEAVHQRLTELLEASRIRTEDEAARDSELTTSAPLYDGGSEDGVSRAAARDLPSSDIDEGTEHTERPRLIASNADATAPKPYYRIADLGDARENQDRFYDDDYAPELRRMALAVIDAEGPVRDDVIARRIARAHGFARTGAKIKQQVLTSLTDPVVASEEESVGRFLWSGDPVAKSVPFRYPRDGDERRSFDEVPMEELLGLVQSLPNLDSIDDPALALAREVGLSRLAKGARERLELAIERSGRFDGD